MPRDLNHTLGKFKKRVENGILKNKKISSHNKKLIHKWLLIKEDELKSRRGREREDEIRWSKTILRYVSMLKNIGEWFNKPLNKLTENDIKELFEKLETGQIKSFKGKAFTRQSRLDYYNKVFKSDFGEFLGIKTVSQKIMKLENSKDEEVKFFEYEDLKNMILHVNSIRDKAFLSLLFDCCLRIGEILNLKRKDFETRYNPETKEEYFAVRVKKDYTKTKRFGTLPTWIPETRKYLKGWLKNITEKEQVVFNFSNANAKKIAMRAANKAEITTKPDGKPLILHDFRKSGATHWLKKGVGIDIVRARLRHKPSSTVIDRYVNYLGLDQQRVTTQIQKLNIKNLEQAFQETKELLHVQVENNKRLKEEIDEIKEKQDKIMNSLVEDHKRKLIKRRRLK